MPAEDERIMLLTLYLLVGVALWFQDRWPKWAQRFRDRL